MDPILHRWNKIQRLHNVLETDEFGDFPLPHFVTFHTCYACNQHCNGCAYSGLLDGQIMEYTKHFALVDFLMSIGVKAFDFSGGGEPTLIPYLRELMVHIKKHGRFFALVTNGTHLDDQIIQFLKDHATYVRISLEAANIDDYTQYKNVSSRMWYQVIKNCQKLHGLQDLSLKFAVGKSLRGYDHYVDALTLAADLDVSRVVFKALRHEPEELSLEEKEHESLLLNEIAAPFKNLVVKNQIVPWPLSSVPQCWLTPLQAVFDAFGNMHLCCYFYCRNDLTLGNIFEGSNLREAFTRLWFSKEHLQKIRGIDRLECAQVDCKFFAHHQAVSQAEKKGELFFL